MKYLNLQIHVMSMDASNLKLCIQNFLKSNLNLAMLSAGLFISQVLTM